MLYTQADRIEWTGPGHTPPRNYTCGYCGMLVASILGWFGKRPPDPAPNQALITIQLCPHCTNPSYFIDNRQVPDVAPGGDVQGLPAEVADLYREARNCVAASAYTGSVLCSRKLLMSVGVAQGEAPGKHFVEYVEYLANQGFVPPNGRGWVDHIRKKGNEATHEIHMMSRPDAVELLEFIEGLLKFIYEFPSRVPP